MATSRITTSFTNLDASPFTGTMLAVLAQPIVEISDGATFVAQSFRFQVKLGQAYATDGVTVANLPVTQSGSATPGNVPITIYQVDATGAERYFASVIIPPESGGVPVVLSSLPAVAPDLTIAYPAVTGLVIRGAYNAGTAYALHDAVYYAGCLWHANQATTAHTPSTTSVYWDLVLAGPALAVTSASYTWASGATSIAVAGSPTSPFAAGMYAVITDGTHRTTGIITAVGASTLTFQPLATTPSGDSGTGTTYAIGSSIVPAGAAGIAGAIVSTIAGLGSAATAGAGALRLVTDYYGGPTVVASDGTSWRTTLGEIITVGQSSYASAMTVDMSGDFIQQIPIAGNILSLATTNRLRGRVTECLFKPSSDATFTRATVATDPFTGASFTSATPRFPAPLKNLLALTGAGVQASEDFKSSTWVKVRCYLGIGLAGAPLAPRTGSQVEKLCEDTSTGTHSMTISLSGLTVGSPAAWSIHAWPDQSGRWLMLALGSGTCYFQLTGSGGVGTASGVTGNIYPLPGGGYRCTVSTATLAGSQTAGAFVASANGTNSYTGDGASGVYIWGAQPEASNAATGYQPTSVTSGNTGLMIEEATPNIFTANQSGVETDTTGFTALASATLSRTTSFFWQGAASLQVVTPNVAAGEGVAIGASCSASTIYTASVWLRGSGTVKLVTSDGSTAIPGSVITLTTAWTRYTITRTTGASATFFNLQIVTDVQQGITFQCDGMQLEQKAYATSWQVGGTARNAETLQVPSAYSPLASGCLAVRVYLAGEMVAAAPTATHYLLDSRDGSGFNGVYIRKDITTGVWRVGIADGSGAQAVTTVGTGPTDEGFHTFLVYWSASALVLLINGVQAASLATITNLPTVKNSVWLGSINNGATNYANGIFSWFAINSTLPNSYALLSYNSVQDPGLPARLSADFSYFIDFSAVSSANGGNLAPTRTIALNSAWKVFGTRVTSIPSGKTLRLALQASGTTEADVMAIIAPEQA